MVALVRSEGLLMDVTGLGTMVKITDILFLTICVYIYTHIYIYMSGSSTQTSLSSTISRVLYPKEYEPS
jgi:hypothetical protein